MQKTKHLAVQDVGFKANGIDGSGLRLNGDAYHLECWILPEF